MPKSKLVMSSNESEGEKFTLEPLSELRFEIESKNAETTITLESGFAEVFGTELVKKNIYKFATGTKLGIFTYQGCVLKVTGSKPDVIYVSKETPMVIYLNCHSGLEMARIDAANKEERGPVVMVVGSVDVGKSTLCRILLNYAARQGRKIFYCDIDVGQGAISIPGTIATILVERPATLDDGFSQKAPLVYHYGHTGPGANSALYRRVVSAMADTVLHVLEDKPILKSSGIIINTCGWVRGEGYKLLVHSAKAFQATHIFVLDQERLYNELKREVPDSVHVILLPKSGGVVFRSREVRLDARELRIKEYFYGGRIKLFPYSVEVDFSDLKLYKIGAPQLPDSCMPIGMKAEDNKTKLVPVMPSKSLLHHMLAVTFADTMDDDVIDRNVAGFVCVTNIDMERQSLTVLSPTPRPLPNFNMLLSEVQFMDNA